VAPLYAAHPDRPDVRARLDALARDLRIDLAAGKAWESGLYRTIDLRPVLPRVQCRTLVIVGELDMSCGPAQARQIAAGVPDAELRIIPDCGHFPQFEAPDAFREAILSWAGRPPR
jgi:pimeloyl-ACP methyl ester carboxylesterase